MDEFSFLGSSELESIEKLYLQYKENPETLDDSWKMFFKGYEFALTAYPGSPDNRNTVLDKEFKVINLINGYRKRGHLFTRTNPVRTRRKYTPSLGIENYELSEKDVNTSFQAGKEIGLGPAKLKDIITYLEDTYCHSIGSEFMFIRNPEKIHWIQEKIERSKNRTDFGKEEKMKIFNLLNQAVGFEQFIHRKFVGQKRFSLEGTETLIPALHYIIESGSNLGISDTGTGMSWKMVKSLILTLLPTHHIWKLSHR